MLIRESALQRPDLIQTAECVSDAAQQDGVPGSEGGVVSRTCDRREEDGDKRQEDVSARHCGTTGQVVVATLKILQVEPLEVKPQLMVSFLGARVENLMTL